MQSTFNFIDLITQPKPTLPNMEYDSLQMDIQMKLQDKHYKEELISQITKNISLNDFVSIDFETANSSRTSACTLGLAKYKNGKLVDKKYWAFKPTPFRFDQMNIQVTGLNPKDFEEAPDLTKIWKEILPYINNNLIIAHNASFDIDVLKKTLIENDIEIPPFSFLCTYVISRASYPDLSNYKLDTIAREMNLHEFKHHNALEDAIICGEIANILFEGKEIETLLSSLKLQLGIYNCYYEQNCKSIHTKMNNTKIPIFKKYSEPVSDTTLNRYNSLFSKNNYLTGKHIAITGDFNNFNRNELTSLLELSDVTIHSTVTKDVSLLILGQSKTQSSKYKKALALIDNGQEINILTEEQLLEKLKGGTLCLK